MTVCLKIAFSPEQDKLILLGDLIDRGPDSYGVLQRVMRLKREMGGNMVILRGSHEILLLSPKWKDKLLWRLVGRNATIRSLNQHGAKISDYARWIEENTVLTLKPYVPGSKKAQTTPIKLLQRF